MHISPIQLVCPNDAIDGKDMDTSNESVYMPR